MKLLPFSIFAFLFLLQFLAAPLWADEILLKNGDRITGTVLAKDDGTVSVQTSYAGTIAIDWQEVQRIVTDEPVDVMLVTKEVVQLSEISADKTALPEQKGAASSEDVQYINPPSYITGKGVTWKGRVTAGVTMTSGNTETENARLDGEVVARTSKKRYTLASTLNYATDNDLETESNVFGLFKLDHFLSEKWYLTGKINLLKDKYKDLNLRTIVGGGLGHQFKESPLLNISAEAGIDYVKEDFIVADDEEYPAAAWSFNYDQYLFRESLQFFHNHTLNVGLEDTQDMLLGARTGFRLPIIDNWNASLEVDVFWDNSPGQDKKRTDSNIIFGLGYAF